MDEQELVSQQVEPNRDATPPDKVDEIFREHSADILAGMTTVLQEFGIQGYSVHTATISVPPRQNPDICIPYFRGIPGNGVEIGCTYYSI